MAPSKKTILYVCLLVAAVAVVAPVAEGTIDLLVSNLFGLIRVQGIVFCSVNGQATVPVTPPFSNATVQLRCGTGNGTLLASVQTDSLGKFSILFDIYYTTLFSLVSGCRAVVATPLTRCNATLPAVGTLTSSLTPITPLISFSGLMPVTNVGLTGFANILP